MSEEQVEGKNRHKMHAHPVVYILVALFGSASWLSTNSVWLELSLLTQKLPEGWSLPSYLALIVQIACIGPLIYTLILKGAKVNLPTPPLVFGLLVMCTVAEFCLAFFWDVTVEVFGKSHSVALFVLMFLMALVNSTSNVLFMPYMATFHPSYLTAYFVGMGFSSLYPSVVSLLQGTSSYECSYDLSKNSSYPVFSSPRFHIQAYTLLMASWMAMTLIAFSLLHFCHDYFANLGKDQDDFTDGPRESSPLKSQEETISRPTTEESTGRSALSRFVILSFCLAFICAQMNAVVPSVQSYATMSYSQLTYHLALALSSLAHPVASFLPMWIQPKGLKDLVGVTVAGTAGCTAIFVLALQSPKPWGVGTVYGPVFSVLVSIFTALLHAYGRTILTSVIREDAPHNESRLFWCGVFMQVGSFIGSLIMFPIVNVAGLFESAPLC
ncbi:unnamed protein product [Bursaphelenchus xylophilus]|uniref:Riboflavin transporter n=1 Tax=Bursaphelenchus xylophilus TaxID=6326 RepID=A0A1I7S619_BURXY|nr:unnamed protein product [Bursaphelenchus xylophilus]CAG9082374.1 unnamed protein product [Bursaphelenchus xylophilus]